MVSEKKMFKIVDGRTDAWVTCVLLAHPWDFGSGELNKVNAPGNDFNSALTQFLVEYYVPQTANWVGKYAY